MKAVKTAVILMSILIVAGFGIVFYTIADRMLSGEPVLTPSSSVTAKAGAVAQFGEINLGIPAGCDLDQVQIEGERLLITLHGLESQPCKQIIILDANSGELLGRVTLRPPL